MTATPATTEQPTQEPIQAPGPFRHDVNIPVPGWPALAQLISQNRELEAFPSFADLAIKSLLYYQAELIYLRRKLNEAEYEDYYEKERPQSRFAGNLSILFDIRDRAISENTELPIQWILVEKIRVTLEKYNATLLQLSSISDFTKADDANVRSLNACAKYVCRGNADLHGPGSQTWGSLSSAQREPSSLLSQLWVLVTSIFVSPNLERELVPNEFQEHLIFPRQGYQQPDSLTLWVLRSFIPFYANLRHKFISSTIYGLLGRVNYRAKSKFRSLLSLWPKRYRSKQQDPESGQYSEAQSVERAGNVMLTRYYSGLNILRVTFIVITVVACLLPTVAIIVLARINSRDLVLKLIAIFTAIFALGLMLFSRSSSRDQVFLATIGFSAVMVVFVQNQVAPQ
ncbi:hypothetical protein V8E51_010697 [Hyaloscypha variabilis]